MARWLYAASKTKAPEHDTLSLAAESGFIWRPFYNRSGIPIACVRQLQPGDELLLGYRHGAMVSLLGRFRIGRPDQPIDASPVFGVICEGWRQQFRNYGYTDDPIVGELVGIFVEECEPLSGRMPYSNQNALSRLDDEETGTIAPPTPARARATVVNVAEGIRTEHNALESLGPLHVCARGPVTSGIHIGIDVGGRCEKGFDLCITEWVGGVLESVHWRRLPHTVPLPATGSLRALVCAGELGSLAQATFRSACDTAAALWRELERFHPAGIHIDSPSAFSRNRIGHGRRCEKRSLTGVSFQSTPSVTCGSQHGGDWGWLLYGMIAFSACLRSGTVTLRDWEADLVLGMWHRFDSGKMIVRECFPTATISVLRARQRSESVEQALGKTAAQPEVEAVLAYLKYGVGTVKRPTQAIYDRADALVAALGALPHVSSVFHENVGCGTHGRNWDGTGADEQIEGTFTCVE
jgi:hypothetical protein